MLKLFFSFLLICLTCEASTNALEWMRILVEKELAYYSKKQFSRQDFEEIVSENKNVFLCSIKNRQIKFFGSFDSPLGEEEVKKRLRCVLKALKYLNAEKNLSNICFLISVEDSFNENLPVLTFAKEKTSSAILIPDFEALRGYQSIDLQIEEGIKQYPYANKIDKGFWRGATTGGIFSLANWKSFPRSQLVACSLKYPLELDAKFSLLLQAEPKEALDLKNVMAKQKMFAEGLSIKDHLKYKFLIDVDGNSCTYSRLYWILKSNSLCIKQLSSHMQWYYPCLEPYKHFLPFSLDFSDLISQIQWARNHPSEVEQIIQNANAFSKEHLRHEDALLYLYTVLENYRDIIDYRSFLKRS